MADNLPQYNNTGLRLPKPVKESKVRMVQRYKEEAVKNASQIDHDTYKRIKHYNKIEMVLFLQQVSASAFKAGYEAAQKELAAQAKDEPEATPAETADAPGE